MHVLYYVNLCETKRYLNERKQFGAPLAAFQINQQKLVHMLGNVQAMVLIGWRLCKLYEAGKMTIGQAGLGKVTFCKFPKMRSLNGSVPLVIILFHIMQSWITVKAREVVSLGRELLGGNGILADFLVAKVHNTFCLKLYYTLYLKQ